MRPTDLRRRLSRAIRRRRRPLAAALAAVGVLVALGSLQPGEATAPGAQVREPALRAGEVAVPVALDSPALARTLSVGDVIDVVGISGVSGVAGLTGDSEPGSARATVVAPGARVLSVPDGGSGFGSTASAVVVLAVRESLALALTAASTGQRIAFVIRPEPSSE